MRHLHLYVFLICFAMIVAQKKAGDCPPNVLISQCQMTCFDDRYCPGSEKCCRTVCGGTTCVEAVTMRRPDSYKAKPGYCPSRPTGPWVCSNRCSLDGDCRGRKKCCKNRCGAHECTMPLAYADLDLY